MYGPSFDSLVCWLFNSNVSTAYDEDCFEYTKLYTE